MIIKIKMINIQMMMDVEWVMDKDRMMLVIRLKMKSSLKDLKIMSLIKNNNNRTNHKTRMMKKMI